MSSLLQAIVSASSSGSAPAPTYNVYRSGGMNEGASLTVVMEVTNVPGLQTVYWEIVGDSVYNPSQQANPSTDLSSSNGYSGSQVVSGTGTYNLTTLINVADNTLEGVEYYAVKLGTSAGASDIGYYGGFNINDTSYPGTGTPGSGDWLGITYTLTPYTNGTGNPGTANPGDMITWTLTSSPADTSGRRMYYWVDNNDVPSNTWVANGNDGSEVLDGSGVMSFARQVVSNPPVPGVFRMYVGMSLYQGFVTHGYISITAP